MNEAPVTALLRCGLLTRHACSDGLYYFSVNRFGAVVRGITSGRKVAALPRFPLPGCHSAPECAGVAVV